MTLKKQLMKLNKHSIGIWGAGVVGTSALRYFIQNNNNIALYDQQPITGTLLELCQTHQVHIFQPHEQQLFLDSCDAILPSAGIDLRPHHAYAHKFLNEIDLFWPQYTKPIIAVTGTLGKTTVSMGLKTVLEAYDYTIQLGGNIGVGLLDLLPNHDAYDYAVIELSSFQLERAHQCTPRIAIWINLYPNHLDRHGTMHEYARAKAAILQRSDYALVHESVRQHIDHSDPITFFNEWPEELKALSFTLKTHPDHYLIWYSVAKHLGCDLQKLPAIFDTLQIPEHRVCYIGSYNGIDFYDDSKSTVIEATQGALSRFTDKNVILFFGGVSKGVSRAPFFDNLPSNVKHICFFGKEAHQLAPLTPRRISSSCSPTLEEAFTQALNLAQPGDVVLFSPGGASFDLFKDYKARGQAFQQLVKKIIIQT